LYGGWSGRLTGLRISSHTEASEIADKNSRGKQQSEWHSTHKRLLEFGNI
jgi:hypothetical protein